VTSLRTAIEAAFADIVSATRACEPHYFHLKILFSDEYTVKSNESINTWNSRYWARINPHWLREIDHQTDGKVNVDVALLEVKSDPIFFDEHLNGDRYSALIVIDLSVLLKNFLCNCT